MEDWVSDVAAVLERLEEILDRSSGDGRVFVYVRDILRLVGWLRSQPRSRVLAWGALGTAAVIALVLVAISREFPPPEARAAARPQEWTGEP